MRSKLMEAARFQLSAFSGRPPGKASLQNAKDSRKKKPSRNRTKTHRLHDSLPQETAGYIGNE